MRNPRNLSQVSIFETLKNCGLWYLVLFEADVPVWHKHTRIHKYKYKIKKYSGVDHYWYLVLNAADVPGQQHSTLTVAGISTAGECRLGWQLNNWTGAANLLCIAQCF